MSFHKIVTYHTHYRKIILSELLIDGHNSLHHFISRKIFKKGLPPGSPHRTKFFPMHGCISQLLREIIHIVPPHKKPRGAMKNLLAHAPPHPRR